MANPRHRIFPQVSVERLIELAKSLVTHLPRGTTFGFVGTLGAGKTRLVQAIAEALEIDSSEVTSPTFTLLQSHQGTGVDGNIFTLHHLDAYRVADEDEFLELGVEELFDDGLAWTIVEWADRVRGVMPRETIWLHFEIEPTGDLRTVSIECEEVDRLSFLERV